MKYLDPMGFQSGPNSDEYKDGWERIFGKKAGPSRYVGIFKDYQDLKQRWGYGAVNFPVEDQVIYAEYWDEDYNGYARILYLMDGKVMETSDNHCSCDGLTWTAGGPVTSESLGKYKTKYPDWVIAEVIEHEGKTT